MGEVLPSFFLNTTCIFFFWKPGDSYTTKIKPNIVYMLPLSKKLCFLRCLSVIHYTPGFHKCFMANAFWIVPILSSFILFIYQLLDIYVFYIQAIEPYPYTPSHNLSYPHIPPAQVLSTLPLSIQEISGLPWISTNMAYQVSVKLITLPCIKNGQSKSLGGVGHQTPSKESETVPAATVRSSTRGPSYTTATHMRSA